MTGDKIHRKLREMESANYETEHPLIGPYASKETSHEFYCKSKQVSVNVWPILVILLAVTALFDLPVNPTITVNFRIDSDPTTGTPVVTILSWQYQKVSLVSSTSVQKAEVYLTGFTNTTNPHVYLLQISVTYGNGAGLTPQITYTVAQGIYQARVIFWPRSELSGVPYVVYVVAKTPSMQGYLGASVNIFPTS